jgi:hypothetical protein
MRARLPLSAVAIVLAGLASAPAANANWSAASRMESPPNPMTQTFNSVGVFPTPDNRFLLASDEGTSRDFANVNPTFAPPTIWPNTHKNAGGARAIVLPGGNLLVAWTDNAGLHFQERDGAGNWVGTRQDIFGAGGGLGQDSAGNITATYAVDTGSTTDLHILTRAAGATSFTDGGAFEQKAFLGTPELTVDPNGAAVLLWDENGAVYQAVRPAGTFQPFGTPTAITNGTATDETAVHLAYASNAAGRSVVVIPDKTGSCTGFCQLSIYRAAIREPGGSFGSATAITSDIPTHGNAINGVDPAAAVAPDGSAAALTVLSPREAHGCASGGPGGTDDTLVDYQIDKNTLGPTASSWSSAGTIGGTSSDTTTHPTLAAGAGSRIEAAWSEDTTSAANRCADTHARTWQLKAGPLGGENVVFQATDQYETNHHLGTAYSAGEHVHMALNGCGDGVLQFAVRGLDFGTDTRASDGLYASTTLGSCTHDAGPGDGGAGGGPSGGGPSGGGGAAGADTTPPVETLFGKTTARLGSTLVVIVGCNEACTATVGGTLSVPGASKTYKLKKATKSIAGGGKAKLKLKLSKKARKAAKRALRRHRKVKAKVRVTVTDAAGNKASENRTIRLK